MSDVMLFFTSLYPIISGAIIFIFLLYIINLIIHRRIKKKIISLLNNLSLQYQYSLKTFNKEKYDFVINSKIISNNPNKLYIKVCYVPKNSSITINSKNTWKLSYGGSGSRPGRHYNNERYLTELVPFLEWDSKEVSSQKVILVYPTLNKVQKYLNESEIAIISSKDISYGYKVITFLDLESHFKDLL
jgi:hypothetical protein